MVMAVICHPAQGRSGRIKDCEEYENALDNFVQFQGAVRKASVITDRCPDPADRGDCQCHQQESPFRHWKEYQSQDREQMNQYDIE
jgi:hypothetical protein